MSPGQRPKASLVGAPASRLIDERIKDLGGWRGETLARLRALILGVDPAITEEWKWNTPVWSCDGIICTGEAYRQVVKLTFAKGASLEDPSGIFNSSLEGNTRRAIDIREGEKLDARAFKALIKAAVTANGRSAKKSKKPVKVKLLSSGNPQIAKADGDAPVQAYIAAMPGWKRKVGERLDAIITRAVKKGELRKAVKWNTPLYGVEGQGFFLGFYCYTHYVQLTFFRGTSLKPVPPKASKVQGTRYFEIREGDALDEARLTTWVKQAAAVPGWVP